LRTQELICKVTENGFANQPHLHSHTSNKQANTMKEIMWTLEVYPNFVFNWKLLWQHCKNGLLFIGEVLG